MRTAPVLSLPVLLIPLVLAPACAQAEDYGAWKKVNKDGSWTRAAEQAVGATSLATLEPKDIATFCPAYATRDTAQRNQFWAGLLSAMARPESNFKPHTEYEEPKIFGADGKPVISRGLLQISIESANAKAYKCGIKQATDLHKVDVNLNCGARIMAHWVAKDGQVAAPETPPRGGARYWSVLRGARGHLDEISGFTRAMAVCKA